MDQRIGVDHFDGGRRDPGVRVAPSGHQLTAPQNQHRADAFARRRERVDHCPSQVVRNSGLFDDKTFEQLVDGWEFVVHQGA